MRRIVLLLLFVGCAEAGKRADTPAGPQIAEAPPTSGTEATAPPQPAPELAHPASPESKSTRDDPPTQAQLASNPAPQPPVGKLGSPTITKGKIEVAGGGKGDTDMVTRYLNKNAANFQLCYEKPLLGNPAIEGQVTLVFDVDATGKVLNGKTMGNMNDEVEKCLVQVASKIAFAKPVKASTINVSYPLTFGWK